MLAYINSHKIGFGILFCVLIIIIVLVVVLLVYRKKSTSNPINSEGQLVLIDDKNNIFPYSEEYSSHHGYNQEILPYQYSDEYLSNNQYNEVAQERRSYPVVYRQSITVNNLTNVRLDDPKKYFSSDSIDGKIGRNHYGDLSDGTNILEYGLDRKSTV